MAWLKSLPTIIGGGVIVALLVLAWWFRADAKNAQAEVSRLNTQVAGLLQVNADQGAAIARLTNQMQIDSQIVTQFTQQLTAIQLQTSAASQALADLEKADPDAKNFLSAPIPDSVKRLLRNGSSTNPGPGNSQRNPAR